MNLYLTITNIKMVISGLKSLHNINMKMYYDLHKFTCFTNDEY